MGGVHTLGNIKMGCPRCSWIIPLPETCCWCEGKRFVYSDTMEKILPCGPIGSCQCSTCIRLIWPNDFKYYEESDEKIKYHTIVPARKLAG